MNAALWELAGPRLWVSRLGNAATEGKSVVVHTQQAQCLPELGRHIASTLTRTSFACTFVECSGGDPTGDLLSIVPGCSGPASMKMVFERLAARTLVVAPTDGQQGWSEFLDRFQHHARACPVADRPRLVFIRLGTGAKGDDVAVEYHDWDQVVTVADIESLVQAWLPPRLATGTLRKVLVRTIAEICLSDVDLLSEMCRLGRGGLATPIVFLEQWGRENTERISPIWIEGKMREHVLADRSGPGLRNRISDRIWRAQATVLLPWIEDLRRAFLPKLENVLPERDDYGLPRDEFEVGPIYFWLQMNRPTNQYLPAFERLRKVRNYVAHRRYLPLEELHADIVFLEKYH